MQILIILAAFAACCLAAPIEELKHPAVEPLERPSPINPDVPMAPKPAEKITMITDPVEFAKHKWNSDEQVKPAQLSPTVLPTVHDHTVVSAQYENKQHEHQHHQQKRADEVLVDSKKVQPLKLVEKSTSTTAKPITEVSSTTPRRTYRPRTTAVPKKNEPIAEVLSHQRTKRDAAPSSTTPAAVAPVPLIFRDDNKQHYVASAPHHVESQVPNIAVHTEAKRDIPVPLVPKHPHPEESPKEDDSDEKKSEVKPEHAVEENKNSQKQTDQPKEETHKEQHNQDVQPKVAVKREDVQVEALHDLTVPAHKPSEQQQDSNGQQQHIDHHLQHHQLQQHAHVAPQQSRLENQQQQHHTYEHHSFHPEHPHVATQQHVEAAAEIDAAPTSTSSTTEHPLFRTKPVPVAELFARTHQ